MPMHTVELGTRELIVIMELTSRAIEGDRFRYPDKSAAKRVHQKAEDRGYGADAGDGAEGEQRRKEPGVPRDRLPRSFPR